MITRARRAQLARMYGLSEEDYIALWDRQGGCCPLCEKRFSARRLPHVEHDHLTGEVFGLLCSPCNYNILGCLGRDPTLYLRAARYLTDPPARHALGRRHFVPGSPPRREDAPGRTEGISLSERRSDGDGTAHPSV